MNNPQYKQPTAFYRSRGNGSSFYCVVTNYYSIPIIYITNLVCFNNDLFLIVFYFVGLVWMILSGVFNNSTPLYFATQ